MLNLGWAVLHALWQVTAIGGAAALAFGFLRDRTPSARLHAASGALVLMALVPLLTACVGETAIGYSVRRTVVTGLDPHVDLAPVVEVLPSLAHDAALLWLVGAGLATAHLFVGWMRAKRLIVQDVTPVESTLEAMTRDVAARVGLDQTIAILYSTQVSSPLVIGWHRPTLLLPRDSVIRLSADELRAVLAHELAHVRRQDYAVNLLQSGLVRLLFFHPAAWWIAGRIREEREYACDDAAVTLDRDAACYAHALAALEDGRDLQGLAVGATSGTLLHRIERLAGRPPRGLTLGTGTLVLATSWALAAVMFAVLITVPPFLPPGSKLRRRTPMPAVGTSAPVLRAGGSPKVR